eukprot:354993-Chlamydomonas_euryale.AAC.2
MRHPNSRADHQVLQQMGNKWLFKACSQAAGFCLSQIITDLFSSLALMCHCLGDSGVACKLPPRKSPHPAIPPHLLASPLACHWGSRPRATLSPVPAALAVVCRHLGVSVGRPVRLRAAALVVPAHCTVRGVCRAACVLESHQHDGGTGDAKGLTVLVLAVWMCVGGRGMAEGASAGL